MVEFVIIYSTLKRLNLCYYLYIEVIKKNLYLLYALKKVCVMKLEVKYTLIHKQFDITQHYLSLL